MFEIAGGILIAALILGGIWLGASAIAASDVLSPGLKLFGWIIIGVAVIIGAIVIF